MNHRKPISELNLYSQRALELEAFAAENEEKANLFSEGREITCSVFGCGHHLSPQEQLFGNRCQDHSIKKQPLDPTLWA